MAYGELITALHADLAALDRDLNAARAKYKQFYADIDRMGARIGTPGGGAGGGSAGGGSRRIAIGVSTRRFDTHAGQFTEEHRGVTAALTLDQKYARDWLAIQKQAKAENLRFDEVAAKRRLELDKFISDDQIKAGKKVLASQLDDERAAARAQRKETQDRRAQNTDRLNDIRQQQRFRREIGVQEARDQRDGMRLAAARAAAEKEETQRSEAVVTHNLATVRSANAQKQALAKEELARISAEEKARAEAAKEFEQTARQTIRQGGQSALTKARDLEKERTAQLQKSGKAASELNDLLNKGVDHVEKFVQTLAVGAVGVLGGLALEALNLNRQLQLQQLTLAANLELTTKIVDANGQYVGRQKEISLNLMAAREMIGQIRKEAESTTLTEQELRPVVGRTLGLSMRAGASREQGVHLISQLANIGKIAGDQGEMQIGNDVRSVLTGTMVSRSRLGQLLGLDAKQIKEAREAGTLIEMLTRKISVADPIVKQANASFDHLFSTLVSKSKDLIQMAAEKTFEKITGRVGELNKVFSDEAVERYAKTLSETIVKAYDAIEAFGKSDGFKAFVAAMKFLAEHAAAIVGIFVALKTLRVANDVTKFFQLVNTALGARGAGAAAAGAAGEAQGGAGAAGLLGLLPALRAGAGRFLGSPVGGVAAAGLAGYGLGATALGISGSLGTQAGTVAAPDLVRDRNERQQRLQGAMAATAGARSHLEGTQAAFNLAPTTENRLLLSAATRYFAVAQANEQKLRQEYDKTAQGHGAALKRQVRDQDDASAKDARDAEEERIAVAKQIAELTGDKEGAIRAEAESKKFAAEKDVSDETRRAALIKAIYENSFNDIHRLRQESVVKQLKIAAEATGNEVQQIRLKHSQAFLDREKEIRETVQANRQKAEIARAFAEEVAASNREVRDKERSWRKEQRDLARQYADEQASIKRERVSDEKELLDLQKRSAREFREIARERTEALREEGRAETDLRFKEVRVGHLARSRTETRNLVGAGGEFGTFQTQVGEPETTGTEQGRLKLRDEARELFDVFNVKNQIQSHFTRRGFAPDLAESEATRHVRELTGQIAQPGGLEGVSHELLGLGVETGNRTALTSQFGARLQELSGRAGALGEREAGVGEQEEAERIRREREDAAKAVTEGKRKIDELNIREADARKTYQEAIIDLQTKLNEQIRSSAEKLGKLGEETRKLAETMSRSREKLLVDFRQLVGLVPAGQGQAQAQAAGAFAPTYNFVFGPGTIQTLSQTGKDALKTVAEELTREHRRAAPSRR